MYFFADDDFLDSLFEDESKFWFYLFSIIVNIAKVCCYVFDTLPFRTTTAIKNNS